MGARAVITRRGGDYRALTEKYEKATRRLVEESGVMVQATAVQSITSGAKSGINYTLYNPRRQHQASAPGEAPAADTGYLHSNIIWDIDSDGMGGAIESRAEYSEFLEFGTSKMAARPFLQPAIEENRPKISRLAERILKRVP